MLHLKWENIKHFYNAHIVTYILFLTFFTSVAIETNLALTSFDKATNYTWDKCQWPNSFDQACKFDRIWEWDKRDQGGFRSNFVTGGGVVILIMVALLVTLEEIVFRENDMPECRPCGIGGFMASTMEMFYGMKEKTMSRIMYFLTICYVVAMLCTSNFRFFHGQVGCWALFLAWIKLTLLLGKLRSTAIYVFMFSYTIGAILKFMLVYATVLIAFACGFHMLLPHNSIFDKFWTALLSVITMMLGELNFSENFTWDDSLRDSAVLSNQILLVLFIITVSIAVMNLLVALALKEVKILYDHAELFSVKKTIEKIPKLPNFLAERTNIFFSLATNLKSSTSSNEDNSNQDAHLSLCVEPFKEKFDFSMDPILDLTSCYKLYFYDVRKGIKSSETGFEVPYQIVKGSLDLLKKSSEETKPLVAVGRKCSRIPSAWKGNSRSWQILGH